MDGCGLERPVDKLMLRLESQSSQRDINGHILYDDLFICGESSTVHPHIALIVSDFDVVFTKCVVVR